MDTADVVPVHVESQAEPMGEPVVSAETSGILSELDMPGELDGFDDVEDQIESADEFVLKADMAAELAGWELEPNEESSAEPAMTHAEPLEPVEAEIIFAAELGDEAVAVTETPGLATETVDVPAEPAAVRLAEIIEKTVPVEEAPAVEVLVEQIKAAIVQELTTRTETIDTEVLEAATDSGLEIDTETTAELAEEAFSPAMEALIVELTELLGDVEPDVVRKLVARLREEVVEELAEECIAGHLLCLIK
jgi:hypothetical protein